MRTSMLLSIIAAGIVTAAAACGGDAEGNPIVSAGPVAPTEPSGPDAGRSDPPATTPPPDGGQPSLPPAEPALAVASESGVHLWKRVSVLTGDVAPDVTLTSGLAGGATTVFGANRRLWVGTADAVRRFDDVASLGAASAPSASVVTTGSVGRLAVDGADRLWATLGRGSVHLHTGASAAMSDEVARFTHPFEQIAAAAYEPTSDRLFAAQISGAGVLAWNQASTRTGSPAHDLALATGPGYWSMQIAGNRLYAGGTHAAGSSGVAIWPDASSLAAGAASVKLTTGFEPNKFISHVVVRDDVLAVAARDQGAILVYKNASAISADRAADFTLTHPNMQRPSRLAIDARANLYAIDDEGVLVFANVGTAPAFVAEITSGVVRPADITLVE